MPGPVFADLAPGVEVVGGVLAIFQADDLGQVLAQEAERPAHRDDVDGHEELVENQDAGIQRRSRARIHKESSFSMAHCPAVGPVPASASLNRRTATVPGSKGTSY